MNENKTSNTNTNPENKKTFRDTKQRDALKTVFAQARIDARILSPKEALGMAQETIPNIGIATVYRNLKTMVERGTLRAVVLPGEADRYQLSEAAMPTELYVTRSGTVFTKKPEMLSSNATTPSDPFSKRTYYFEN